MTTPPINSDSISEIFNYITDDLQNLREKEWLLDALRRNLLDYKNLKGREPEVDAFLEGFFFKTKLP
jgi:hypothetical protein